MKALRKPQILVLDSDPAVLEYVQRILEERFRVSLFTEAAELSGAWRNLLHPTCY